MIAISSLYVFQGVLWKSFCGIARLYCVGDINVQFLQYAMENIVLEMLNVNRFTFGRVILLFILPHGESWKLHYAAVLCNRY